MKLFSMEFDGEVYIVCDDENNVVTTNEDWSVSDIIALACEGAVPYDNTEEFNKDVSELKSRIIKAVPKAHHILEGHILSDVLSGIIDLPAEVLALASKNPDGPMLSLIKCNGDRAQLFRMEGLPVDATSFIDNVHEYCPKKMINPTTSVISNMIH